MTIGVLLVNVGTPDATDLPSIRKYLQQFMSDPKVINKSGLLWKLLLRHVIIPKRAPVIARAYQAIWNAELDESPLRTTTRAQATALQDSIGRSDRVIVDWAMRYGTPSISDGMNALVAQGCDRILIAPLYPQYCSATTGSVMDEVYKSVFAMHAPPTLRMLPPYYGDPAYIETMNSLIQAHLDGLDWSPEVLLLSFHGLPQTFIDRGEPYRDHCEATADRIRQNFEGRFDDIPIVFQSRSRHVVWTGPELEDSLEALAKSGIRKVCVATPGFAADCLETIEEIGLRAADHFRAHGGDHFSRVPCPEASPAAIRMLTSLVTRELEGWD